MTRSRGSSSLPNGTTRPRPDLVAVAVDDLQRALGLVFADRQPQLVRRERKRRAREIGRHQHFDAVRFEQALDDVGFDLRRRAKDDGQVTHGRAHASTGQAGPACPRRRTAASRTPRGRHDRQHRPRVENLARRNREDVAREHDEVREIARPEPALSIFGELGVGGPAGVAVDRLRQRDALLREPPLRPACRPGTGG